eukprot:5375779-Pyramimonas_sp.AAC.1
MEHDLCKCSQEWQIQRDYAAKVDSMVAFCQDGGDDNRWEDQLKHSITEEHLCGINPWRGKGENRGEAFMRSLIWHAYNITEEEKAYYIEKTHQAVEEAFGIMTIGQ